jgi:hypothetical protein
MKAVSASAYLKDCFVAAIGLPTCRGRLIVLRTSLKAFFKRELRFANQTQLLMKHHFSLIK